MRAHRQRGFTLIELMVTVAIVGILASIAIPSFQRMQLRARTAERTMLVTTIVRSMDEYYAREDKFPLDLGGATMLYLWQDQPDATPTTRKRPWRYAPLNSVDHWNLLSMTVEGGVYYSYRAYAIQSPGYRYYYVSAYGDLDGDLAQNTWVKEWTYQDGILQRFTGGTLDCPECSVAYETNPWTF